jgi:hypothetical protein
MKTDENKNEAIGGRMLDITEHGRVDVTIFKMDTGFILQNNDNDKQHSLGKIDDITAAFDNLVTDIKERLRNLLNNKSKYDYVDIGIQLTEGYETEDMYQYEPQESEPINLSLEQLAEIVTDAVNQNPTSGLAGRGKRGIVINASMLRNAMNAPEQGVRLRQRMGRDPRNKHKFNVEPDKHSNDLPKKKIFFDGGKNKHISKNKPDNDGGPKEISAGD